MSVAVIPMDISWNGGSPEDRRFQRILSAVMILFLIIAVGASLLPVFKQEREQQTEVPKRIARLVLEKRKPPPPPPAPKVEQKQPEPKAEPKPEAKPEPKPQEVRKSARERAAKAGVLAFANTLAELRDAPTTLPSAPTRPLSQSGTQPKETTRSLITSGSSKRSSGINTAKLSRDTGTQELSQRATQQVESPVVPVAPAGSGSGRGGPSRDGSRSDEEIQLVFDRNKNAIYNLYNRSLRQNPALKGKVVFRLTIDPSGQVSAVSIVSSELRDDSLEKKLLLRVKRLDFGAKDVASVTVNYTMDFFPS